MKIVHTTDYELIAKLNKPVHDLHTSLYPEYFKAYNKDTITDAFKAIMANEQNMFFVIKDNKESVGYVWAEVRNYKENAFRKGYQSVFVHQICVNQTDRKNGYGSKLMERVYQIAENNNIDVIELDYWIGNDVMERFCIKHGFKKHREFVFKRMD